MGAHRGKSNSRLDKKCKGRLPRRHDLEELRLNEQGISQENGEKGERSGHEKVFL